MGATLVMSPERIEATGTTYTYELPPIAGFGQVKDVLVMAKIHKVKATASTQIAVQFKHSPDGDMSCSKIHSMPITASTVSSEPELLVGDTDSGSNGPIGEYIHPRITVSNANAGHWAMVELFFVKKPT